MPNSSNHSSILNGIDISHWQGDIDWPAVADSNKVGFVIIKATEGATWQDPKFQANWQAIKRQGIPIVGAYHFFRSTSLPADQANNLLNQLKQVNFSSTEDLVAIVVGANGIGTLTPSKVSDNVRQLIGNLSDPVISSRVLIQTPPKWWNSHVQDIGYRLSQQPLWVAHWTTAKGPQLPNGWNDWKIWQYTDQGAIPGIQESVNLNRMQTKSLVDREASEMLPVSDALKMATTESVVPSAASQNSSILSELFKIFTQNLKNLMTYLINRPPSRAAKIDQVMNSQPSQTVDSRLQQQLSIGQQLMKEAFILQQRCPENLIQILAMPPEGFNCPYTVSSLNMTSYVYQSTALPILT